MRNIILTGKTVNLLVKQNGGRNCLTDKELNLFLHHLICPLLKTTGIGLACPTNQA